MFIFISIRYNSDLREGVYRSETYCNNQSVCLPATLVHPRMIHVMNLVPLFRIREASRDKIPKQWMGEVWLGEKFRMELAGHEPGMIADFNEFH